MPETLSRSAEADRPTVALHADPPSDVPAATLALSAVALGCALQVNFGQYHPLALLWLTVALAGVVLCIAKPHASLVRTLERRQVPVLTSCLVVQFALLLSRSPGATGALAGDAALLPFRIGIAIAGALCAAGLSLPNRWRTLCLVALLLTHALLGAWVLRAAPNPGIDVVLFQRESADALLRGDNPYAITFADPYANASANSSHFYGPGVSVDGRLTFGYPYPPLSLLLTTPAHLLGDFRYAQLASMTLAGALVALARPGRVAFAAAALLLFTPRGFLVLEAGWTEPLSVLMLAATVFVACRAPHSLPMPLGLLLASKQYLVLALLAAPRLTGCHWRLLFGKTALVAALVTLPLALWEPVAFWQSAVALQFRQPFRTDALSYLVPLAQQLGTQPPAWIAFALALAAALFAVRKLPRTPAAFAATVGFTFLVFFASNKQAFCNYYHFVIGALCCAVASVSCSAPDRVEGHKIT